jgi:hypothetical protein
VAHVNAVPTGVAAPRARQAKRACGSSTGMWRGPHLYAHQQACGVQLHAYMHNVHVHAGGRAGIIMASRAGVGPFLHEWSAFP